MFRKSFFSLLIVVALISFFMISISEAKITGPGDPVLEKAMRYILSIQNPDGSWPLVKKEGGGDLEATLWATRSVFMNRKIGHSEYGQGLDGLAFFITQQGQSGSFSDNSAHTAFAIMALKAASQGKEAMGRAVAWLKKVQNSDGGWRAGLGGPSLSIYTSVVLTSFKMAGIPGTDPAVKSGIAWLKEAQNPDGGWGMPKGGRSLSLGSSWALTALAAYGHDSDAKCVESGISWLLEMQTERNGGFVIFRHPAITADPELTAYAILALSKFKGYGSQIARAIEYLSDVQKPGGVFVSNTPKEFKKKRKPNTQTTCFVIWALKAAGY